MYVVRKAEERGFADYGWLKTAHTFSFSDYYDPKYMGFGPLRVINEDYVAPKTGFPMHAHRDMEIITYVTQGKLAHKDTMGNAAEILPGEVQTMSAGTGVRHSEFSATDTETTRLFQIWITPDASNYQPSYGQKSFQDQLEGKDLVLVVSKSGEKGSLKINQDAKIYLGQFKEGYDGRIQLQPGRRAWIQMIHGSLEINGHSIQGSDALAIAEVTDLKLKSQGPVEFILFDLP